jgi:hypothetical protein
VQAQASSVYPSIADVADPSAEPTAKDSQSVTRSGTQLGAHLSQELWNRAYDELESEHGELVEAYRNILAKVLVDDKLEDLKDGRGNVTSEAEVKRIKAELLPEFRDGTRNILTEREDVITKKGAGTSGTPNTLDGIRAMISAELKDPSMRQRYMEVLVEKGMIKIMKASRASEAVSNVCGTILLVKPALDIVLRIPQAAPATLPWAGVCLGLNVSNNPSIPLVSCELICTRSY